MRHCLFCGNEIANTATFCRGHVTPYRTRTIRNWNSLSDEDRERAERVFQRMGWWDSENDAPADYHGFGVGNSRRTVRSSVERTSIEYRFRKFGIELETTSSSETVLNAAINMAKASGISIQNTGYTHNRTSYWKVLTDASLRGGFCREIVSPAFATEAGLTEAQTMAQILTTFGVKTNNTCGFHVHLDVSDLTPRQFARAVKFYQVYETEIDKLHQGSRRASNAQWCKSLVGFDFNPDNITAISDLRNIFRDRYFKVNVEAYMRHGTIEFRQHGATTDGMKIVNWVKFCTRIIEFAKTENPIDSRVDLFDALNLSEAERCYWNLRKEVLATA